MRNVLVFALLIGAGFAVAGFFAHGMARLSGITPATAGGARADTRKSVQSLQSADTLAGNTTTANTKTANATIENAPPSTAAADTPLPDNVPTNNVPTDNVPTDSVPIPSEEIASSPVVSELKTAAPVAPRVQSAPQRAVSIRPAPLAPNPSKNSPKAALVIPPSLSTAEAREAQCRSLSAYLSELDTIARTRSEPGVQVWIQHQRTTTWERQTELRC